MSKLLVFVVIICLIFSIFGFSDYTQITSYIDNIGSVFNNAYDLVLSIPGLDSLRGSLPINRDGDSFNLGSYSFQGDSVSVWYYIRTNILESPLGLEDLKVRDVTIKMYDHVYSVSIKNNPLQIIGVSDAYVYDCIRFVVSVDFVYRPGTLDERSVTEEYTVFASAIGGENFYYSGNYFKYFVMYNGFGSTKGIYCPADSLYTTCVNLYDPSGVLRVGYLDFSESTEKLSDFYTNQLS